MIAFINVKTKLQSGYNIAVDIIHNGMGYTAVCPHSGAHLFSLPADIVKIPSSGTIYEDDALLIYA